MTSSGDPPTEGLPGPEDPTLLDRRPAGAEDPTLLRPPTRGSEDSTLEAGPRAGPDDSTLHHGPAGGTVDRALRPTKVVPRSGSGLSGGGATLPSELPHGYELGHFQVLRRLGAGAMGDVYCALDRNTGREVALKTLHTAAFKQADAKSVIDRFLREARATAKLDHDGIVRVHEAGDIEGVNYISMQLIDGRNLSEMLGKRPMGDPARAAELMLAITRAIQHAHESGILHRDLKPSNILLDAQDRPFVADFGLAQINEDTRLTMSGQSLGTPSYMSPEQAEGDARYVTQATDVYGLGAILYEMLSGRPPIKGDTLYSTVYMVIHDDPDPPTRYYKAADPHLTRVCMKCLEKAPENRYQTAAELAEDLERYLSGKGVRARSRRRPLLPILFRLSLVLGVLGAAVFGGWRWWRWVHERDAGPGQAIQFTERRLPRVTIERGMEGNHPFPAFDKVSSKDPTCVVATRSKDGSSVTLVGVKAGETLVILEQSTANPRMRYTVPVRVLVPLAEQICVDARKAHADADPSALTAEATRLLARARQLSESTARPRDTYQAYLASRQAWCLLEPLAAKPPAFYEAYKLSDSLSAKLSQTYRSGTAELRSLAGAGKWGLLDLRSRDLAARFPDARDWRGQQIAGLRQHYLIGEYPLVPIQDACLIAATVNLRVNRLDQAQQLLRAAAGFAPPPAGMEQLLTGKLAAPDLTLYRRTGIVELARTGGDPPASDNEALKGLFARANAQFAERRYDPAARTLDELLKLEPNPANWYHAQARLMLRALPGPLARQALEQASRCQDEDPATAAALIRALREMSPGNAQASQAAEMLMGKVLIGLNIDRQLYQDEELSADEFRKKLSHWHRVLTRLDRSSPLLKKLEAEMATLK